LNSKVSYKNFVVEPSENETVLEALLRVGADMPFSCKGGSCLTCLSQCTEGVVPEAAQKGLSEHLRQANYVLPCKCIAESNMTLRSPQPQDMITGCMLVETSGHDRGELRVKFEPMHFGLPGRNPASGQSRQEGWCWFC
jgi:ferredoxin